MSLRDYFSNNKIFTGTEKPTQGKFGVGDIIVNIGPNSAEEPMWICVEAGTPGVWELCSGVNEEEIADIVQANALTAVDYTDGVDIQIDGGNIGNMNELQTTDKSSIVGAINELFQSANNGKELIANAIGEPLDASDTFSAMSNDINSLLSTFKTNMMNSGVMVESSDKFKSLIDKIKGLTEGEGNKGIQFAEGTFSKLNDLTTEKTVTYDLDFTPTMLFVVFNSITNNSAGIVYKFCISNIDTISLPAPGYSDAARAVKISLTNITNESFTILDSSYYTTKDTGGGKWYAIGVGEEDTTLRDSLASILTEEGVSVSEEDDMASLITKVDEEFDNKNASIKYKGSDIIVSTDLPQEVVNNRIVIIAENCNGMLMDNKDISEVMLNEGDVYIKYGFESNLTEELNAPDCPIAIHLETVYQSINGELKTVDNIYKGIDGIWVKVLDNEIYIYHDNIFKFPCDTGINNLLVNTSYSINTSGEYKNYLNFKIGDSNGKRGLWSFLTNEKIDLTSFSKLELSYVLKCTDNSYLTDYYDPGYVGLAASTERVFYTLTDTTLVKKYNSIRSFRNEVNAKKVIELDISDLNDLYYVGLVISNNDVTDITASSTLIEYIKLIK